MKKNSKIRHLHRRKSNFREEDDLTEYVSASKSVQDMIRIKDRIGKAKENVEKVEKHIKKYES